ncbi:hypothetical protein Tco_0863685 [Tanacetum coccineum]
MEEASLHTTRKHLFISTQYYDKHGVPPTKRLFKVAMLDPSPEFIGPWGTSGDLGLPIVDMQRMVLKQQTSAPNGHSLEPTPELDVSVLGSTISFVTSGGKPEGQNLVCNHTDVEMTTSPSSNTTMLKKSAFTESGKLGSLVFLIEKSMLYTISFSSSNIEDENCWGRRSIVLTLETMALLREL